jgi:hypothetical protein
MEKVICLVLLLAILGVSVATLVKKEDCKNKEKYCGASSSPQNKNFVLTRQTLLGTSPDGNKVFYQTPMAMIENITYSGGMFSGEMDGSSSGKINWNNTSVEFVGVANGKHPAKNEGEIILFSTGGIQMSIQPLWSFVANSVGISGTCLDTKKILNSC